MKLKIICKIHIFSYGRISINIFVINYSSHFFDIKYSFKNPLFVTKQFFNSFSSLIKINLNFYLFIHRPDSILRNYYFFSSLISQFEKFYILFFFFKNWINAECIFHKIFKKKKKIIFNFHHSKFCFIFILSFQIIKVPTSRCLL